MYPQKKSVHDSIIVLLIKIKKGKLPKHSSPEEWISACGYLYYKIILGSKKKLSTAHGVSKSQTQLSDWTVKLDMKHG